MTFDLKTRVPAALDRGVNCLRSRQRGDGTWSDFDISIWGSSDDWLTAYVCCALRAIESNVAREMRALARQAISVRQRLNGGWGYNNKIPPDADSTSFAIRAVHANNANYNHNTARTFLLKHQDGVNGGFKTYSSQDDLRDLDRKSGREGRSFAGWCSAHVEVTASALESLNILTDEQRDPITSAVTFLENSQNADGLWSGYWATDTYYPTYRSVVALHRFRPAGHLSLSRAGATLRGKQQDDGAWRPSDSTLGCPFRTALAAETLLLMDVKRDAITAATQWLLDHQGQDGRWVSKTPFLRIPPPDVLFPDEYQNWGLDGSGRGAKYLDIGGILTTATVLSFLARYLQ